MITIRFISKRCVICLFKHRGAYAVCKHCFEQLPRLHHPCLYCATPLFKSRQTVCESCLTTPPVTDHLNIHYPFIEPLRSLIHSYKFHHSLYLSSFLSSLILEGATHQTRPELLIPVPLHSTRLSTRGFNQAALITTDLSRKLRIPYDTSLCKKIKHTLPQASLSANMRETNLIDSFEVSPLSQQHVALIDDVYTTGATVNALALLLKQQGVKRVDVWCIAKTVARQ